MTSVACAGSSPTFQVWKTITLGTHKDLVALKAALKSTRCAVEDRAEDLLDSSAFIMAAEQTKVDLVVLSNEELVSKADATHREIYARAIELGLELSPAEVGPSLRLAYDDQPFDNGPYERLQIAMEPYVRSDGASYAFLVTNEHGFLHLGTTGGDPDLERNSSCSYVFVLPRRK